MSSPVQPSCPSPSCHHPLPVGNPQYLGGEPCAVCGHRLEGAGARHGDSAAAPPVVKPPSAFPSEIVPGFLYLGSYDHASRHEILKTLGIGSILSVRDRGHSRPGGLAGAAVNKESRNHKCLFLPAAAVAAPLLLLLLLPLLLLRCCCCCRCCRSAAAAAAAAAAAPLLLLLLPLLLLRCCCCRRCCCCCCRCCCLCWRCCLLCPAAGPSGDLQGPCFCSLLPCRRRCPPASRCTRTPSPTTPSPPRRRRWKSALPSWVSLAKCK